MQYSNKEFDPAKHDRYRALTVKQPYATKLVTAVKDIDGVTYGLKSIEVRSKPTKYRGDLLICSSVKPDLPGYDCGCTLGFVELYDVKPFAEFTPDDWENTQIPKEARDKIKGGYGWMMRNPRRVIEFPIKGQLGIYNLVYTKGDIMFYPEAMILDKKGLEIINERVAK